MKERGFYIMLALTSVLGIALTAFLVYKAAKLPSIYSPNGKESVSTSSAVTSESNISSPSSSKEAEPSRASFPIIVTRWKTYQNDKYGFSFRYPANWSLRQKEDAPLSPPPYAIASIDITFITDMRDELGQPRFGGLDLFIYQNPQSITLEKWIRRVYYDDKANLLQLSKPTANIGNALEAFFISDDKSYWGQHPDVLHSNLPNYYIRTQSRFYVLAWYQQIYTYNVGAIESQILPTFFFTK